MCGDGSPGIYLYIMNLTMNLIAKTEAPSWGNTRFKIVSILIPHDISVSLSINWKGRYFYFSYLKFPNFLNSLIMSKRFERGASKRRRKKIEYDIVKKMKPIVAFLHQPLKEATGSEGGVMTLAEKYV